jgi:flavorubredoxin
MNTVDLVGLGNEFSDAYDRPTLLFQDNFHCVYWLGIPGYSAFRCNTYMVTDGQEAFIIDPGGHGSFPLVKQRVSQILPPESVTALVLSHQDPDVAASMTDWISVVPDVRIFTSIRTNILLPHYGSDEYTFVNINENPVYTFKTGRQMKFIESPFLHFPGACTTYDEMSGFLFSGDIWATIDADWKLVVTDFEEHRFKLDLFHLDYMAGNIAARGFHARIHHLKLNALMPQHGSIISKENIPLALEYLENLRCGLDLIYPPS